MFMFLRGSQMMPTYPNPQHCQHKKSPAFSHSVVISGGGLDFRLLETKRKLIKATTETSEVLPIGSRNGFLPSFGKAQSCEVVLKS